MTPARGIGHDATVFHPKGVLIFVGFPSFEGFAIEHRYPAIFRLVILLVMLGKQIATEITIEIAPYCMYMVYAILGVGIFE